VAPFFGPSTVTTNPDGTTTRTWTFPAVPLSFPGFDVYRSEAELQQGLLRDTAWRAGVAAEAVQDAMMRDPGGFDSVRRRVLAGGPLEYYPYWDLDVLARALQPVTPFARKGYPRRKGRIVYRAHQRTHWARHG